MTVGLPLGAVTLRPMALTGNVGQASACPNLDMRVNLPLTVGSPPKCLELWCCLEGVLATSGPEA